MMESVKYRYKKYDKEDTNKMLRNEMKKKKKIMLSLHILCYLKRQMCTSGYFLVKEL